MIELNGLKKHEELSVLMAIISPLVNKASNEIDPGNLSREQLLTVRATAETLLPPDEVNRPMLEVWQAVQTEIDYRDNGGRP